MMVVDALRQLGPRLRAVRQARGWTLDDLATRAGMSVSTLSRLEAGKRQASLELLLPVTRELGIRIEDLLPAEDADPRVRRPAFQHDGLIIAPLTPESSPIRTYKITYPEGRPLSDPRAHDGYEWLYVLGGRLHLRLGEQDLTLSRGEAAEFDTRMPHAMAAIGGRSAEVLSIFNDAGARMHTHTAPDHDLG